jgi:hypothetical protein
MRAKGPQPVIDSLGPPEDNQQAIAGPSTYYEAPRATGLREPTVVVRSSTFALQNEVEDNEREQTASPALSNRPRLLRAQTDFGPRRDSAKQDQEDSDLASTELEWGIRHGFDTQLGSEEYTNLLTSVSLPVSGLSNVG